MLWLRRSSLSPSLRHPSALPLLVDEQVSAVRHPMEGSTMGKKPVNAVKGKQGFQRTAKSAPLVPEPCPSLFPDDEELKRRAAQVEELFGMFRTTVPEPLYADRMSLLYPSPCPRLLSGMMSIKVPMHAVRSADVVFQEALVGISARERNALLRTRSSLGAYTDPAECWSRGLRALFPDHTHTIVRRLDGLTLTVGFVEARWTQAIEGFLAQASRSGCTITGEACDEESAYTFATDPAWGIRYRDADFADDDG
jgi:hypothetical protein